MNACGALLALRSLSLLMEITKVPTTPTNDELTVYQVSRSTRMRVMKSSNVKRSIVIDGHSTSVASKMPSGTALKKIAHARRMSLPKMVTEINEARQHGNLSSAIRLLVLDQALNHGKKRGVKK